MLVRGGPWRVGVQHPRERDRLAAVLSLTDAAVATSGAYERGEHIVDPLTGRPPSGALAVTVLGRDLATADAYATAAFAMGERGPAWTARPARLRGDDDPRGRPRALHASASCAAACPCRLRDNRRDRSRCQVMAVPFRQIADRAHSAARWRDEALPTGGRWGTLVEVWRAAKRHRTTGHAAEMAFFAVLTLVPSTIAVGSALGLSERLVSAGVVAKAEQAASDAVRVLMGPQLADDVITPFVHAQLTQPHRDVALGALLIAWWLSSHLFMATSHALDDCYGVRDHRPTLVQRFIALAFGLASVAVVAVTAEMMVSGPLGELTGDPARTLGIEGAYEGVWSIVRWPIGFALVVGFLICLYRFSANVRHHWRDCLPGRRRGRDACGSPPPSPSA